MATYKDWTEYQKAKKSEATHSITPADRKNLQEAIEASRKVSVTNNVDSITITLPRKAMAFQDVMMQAIKTAYEQEDGWQDMMQSSYKEAKSWDETLPQMREELYFFVLTVFSALRNQGGQ